MIKKINHPSALVAYNLRELLITVVCNKYVQEFTLFPVIVMKKVA